MGILVVSINYFYTISAEFNKFSVHSVRNDNESQEYTSTTNNHPALRVNSLMVVLHYMHLIYREYVGCIYEVLNRLNCILNYHILS